MLIRRTEINFSEVVDIRIADGIVAEIAQQLSPLADEDIIDADGRALIPGLHDHHIHFLASAAARESLFCGPPQIIDENTLREVLQQHAASLPHGKWLRGIGYHASVAGDIDRHWIDRIVADVPARIQHRSGRLWILNSCALQKLGNLDNSPLEKINGEYSGRLYDADTWLRERIGRQLPNIAKASLQLVRYGVTGFTDTSVSNTAESFAQFAQWQARGELLQHVVLMGNNSLAACENSSNLQRGALKMHLHENALPEFEAMCAAIAESHAASRPVAVHCVTLVELAFTLNAFAEVGTIAGDRIEHAAIAPPELLEQLSALKLSVVTQPNFIAERGDAYLHDVDSQDQPWLYRLRGYKEAGIALAGGTDAPFGDWNPWAAMQAAVTRRTESGAAIGVDEALTPEQALELFLGDPLLPGAGKNRIEAGMAATLCLLDHSWQQARNDLSRVNVSSTFIDGRAVFQL